MWGVCKIGKWPIVEYRVLYVFDWIKKASAVSVYGTFQLAKKGWILGHMIAHYYICRTILFFTRMKSHVLTNQPTNFTILPILVKLAFSHFQLLLHTACSLNNKCLILTVRTCVILGTLVNCFRSKQFPS